MSLIQAPDSCIFNLELCWLCVNFNKPIGGVQQTDLNFNRGKHSATMIVVAHV